MELKRYVLLENNEIFDLYIQSILGEGKREGSGYMGYQLKIGSQFVTTQFGNILKTSDNILELVEKGDMVEYLNIDSKPITIEVLFMTPYKFEAWNNYCLKSGVTAIWKRNGNTMTRYEVQK